MNETATASGVPTGPRFSGSMIQRAWERPEEVVMQRHVIESPALQPEDIGVLARLLIRDPAQPATIVNLAREFQDAGWKMGESRFTAILKRLKGAGHVEHVSEFNPSTGRPQWVFRVYRNPANNGGYVNQGADAALQVRGGTAISTVSGAERSGETVDSTVSRGRDGSVEYTVSAADPWNPEIRETTVSQGQSRNRGNRGSAVHPPHPPEEEVTTSPIPKKRRSRGAEEQTDKATPATPAVTDEQAQAAAAFLMRLPGAWAVGRLKARNLGVELAAAVAETGWDLDLSLKAWLTRKESGKTAPRSHVVVLEYRVKNLELRESVLAAPAEEAGSTVGPAVDGIPDWCGQCNDGEKPLSLLMRTVPDPDPDSDRVDLCPRCHPRAIRA